MQTIDAASVGTVITLCAEEVCPGFLGKARRLHWPIPDPASKDPSIPREEMLTRFRAARDTLRQKLGCFAVEEGMVEVTFERAPRESAPDALSRSSEFASICPASAVCMTKRL